MEKGEKKEERFSIKEVFTNKQYRSIMILAFYVVLFAILIVAIRSPKDLSESGDNGASISSLAGYELIDGRNFNYKYIVQLDDETYVYEGKKYNNKDLFTVSNGEESKEYYVVDESVYVKNGDKFKRTISKPILVFDFFDTDVLDHLIERGVSTEEKNHYKIDSQDLYVVLNSDNSKVEKSDNFVTLTYRNSYITGITFELTNYANLVGERCASAIITLEYFDFNLIDDFGEINVE